MYIAYIERLVFLPQQHLSRQRVCLNHDKAQLVGLSEAMLLKQECRRCNKRKHKHTKVSVEVVLRQLCFISELRAFIVPVYCCVYVFVQENSNFVLNHGKV